MEKSVIGAEYSPKLRANNIFATKTTTEECPFNLGLRQLQKKRVKKMWKTSTKI